MSFTRTVKRPIDILKHKAIVIKTHSNIVKKPTLNQMFYTLTNNMQFYLKFYLLCSLSIINIFIYKLFLIWGSKIIVIYYINNKLFLLFNNKQNVFKRPLD